MRQKRVVCRGHCPIFVEPDYPQPWADVWVRFKGRPGKVFTFGPTLVTKRELEVDLMLDEQVQAEHPEFDYSEEINDNRKALDGLAADDIVVGPVSPYGTPSIYTTKDFIDRREAERMLAKFIGTFGYRNLKFIWKRPKIIACPVGLSREEGA